jgi:glutathione S-transferase
MPKPVVYHIPVCPFSQRLETLLALKGLRDEVDFHVVDITVPRPEWLLQKTRRQTSLPALETPDGVVLRESLVLMQWLEDTFPEPRVAERDPTRRALEGWLASFEGDFVAAGYRFVMNQQRDQRAALEAKLLAQYQRLDDFLVAHALGDTFLFESFGWAEVVYTPIFMRFWFLDYYEGFTLGDGFARVRRWREACLAHPAAQQVTREEVVKLYYDYAKGVGNGALPPGRSRSSFAFEPRWSERPWPPADKYDVSATDAELGLLG